MILPDPRVIVAGVALAVASAALGAFGGYRYASALADEELAELRLKQTQAVLTQSNNVQQSQQNLSVGATTEDTRTNELLSKKQGELDVANATLASLQRSIASQRASATSDAFVRQREGVERADPIAVYGELLARHGAELVAVSTYADGLKLRGLSCEVRYDALDAELRKLYTQWSALNSPR